MYESAGYMLLELTYKVIVGGALKSALGRRDEIVLDVVAVVFGVSSA